MALANGLIPSNMLDGAFVNFGGYEQCLQTRVRSSDGELYFKGQYCSIFLQPPPGALESLTARFQEIGELTGRFDPTKRRNAEHFMNTDYRGSICMPSLCTTEDLNFLARSVLGIYGANATVADCRTDDPKPLTRLQAAAIATIGAFFVLVAIGTAVDWHLIKTASTKKVQALPVRILHVFSAIDNTRFLLNTDLKPQNEPLKFISGLKVIMAFWVVLGHAYLLTNLGFFHSIIEPTRLSKSVIFMFIPNGFLSVVTFFFLSGFLLSYNSAAARKTILKANSFLFFLDRFLRRYVRLTFPMMFVMLVAFLLPLMGSGPADKETYEMMVQECATSWWRVLTHNNNFLQDRAMCLQHFWYVGADMQIFVIIALPLTMLIIRFPKISCAIGIVAAVAFSALTSVQIHLWDQLYAFNFGTYDTVKLSESLSLIYFRPFTHVGSYVLGILCGYLAFVHKEVHIHWLVQKVLWLASLALGSFVIFVTYPWNNGTTPDDVTAALYGGFHRTLWALVFFWPSYACATGRGGLLCKFLGWNLFLPLSRLTYCIYLVHGLVFYLRSMRVRTLIQMDEFFQFLLAAGVFTVSIFFAYLVHLMVEAPTIRFEKMILDRPTRLKSETNGRQKSEDKMEKSQL